MTRDDPFTRPAGRFLSRAECAALFERLTRMASGGGATDVFLDSRWTGNLRWARNRITTSGDVRDNDVGIARTIRGATNRVQTNQLADPRVAAAVRRAERLLRQRNEDLDAPLKPPYTEPFQTPALWFDRTYQLDADARADVMRSLVAPAVAAGMLAAGYLQVSATGRAVYNSSGRALYLPYTQAQYSVTIRDPQGTASGWAGVDWNDWGRIDAAHLSAVALEKCLTSRQAAAIEPGRYTTILEPQAVCDFVAPLFDRNVFDRRSTEEARPQPRPFSGEQQGTTKIGQRVVDERLTFSADPMDPECSFVPFALRGRTELDLPVYHAVNWIERGVLMALAYDRTWGITNLGVNTGLPDGHAFHLRVEGPTATPAEMIASTKRGLLVTRLDRVSIVDDPSTLAIGTTRDGLWLIERGAVSKPVKNMFFMMPILAALNSVVQLGAPQRVFRPEAPAVVPALKIQDFNFSQLTDAV